jgi:hypothetical protein
MNGYKLENSDTKSLRVKGSGGLFLFKDSNRFYHHAKGKAGGPIDFLMMFEGKDFLRAVEHLIGVHPEVGDFVPPPHQAKKEKVVLALPEKAPNAKRAFWYLCGVRGIEPKIVSKLMNEKKIYQQAERGNVVFVGFDENKTPRYCAKRGTSPDNPYKGDQAGSDKSYPFSMEGTSNRLYVLESPIDALSHATLTKMHNVDENKDHRISLGCLSDAALGRYLKHHPEIRQIVFALDNDTNGTAPDGSPCNHGQEAAKKYAEKYKKLGYSTAVQIPVAKDWNEDLVAIRMAQERGQGNSGEHELDEDKEDLEI